MRRTDREIRDTAVIDEILKQGTVLYLGLVDNGQPYVVPMYYGYQPGRLYLHSAREGRKVDIISRNPHVAFTVVASAEVVLAEKGCGCSARYRSVMGTGTAVVVDDDAERRRGLDALMSRFAPGKHEYPPQAMARTLVIRIDIESLTGKQAGQ